MSSSASHHRHRGETGARCSGSTAADPRRPPHSGCGRREARSAAPSPPCQDACSKYVWLPTRPPCPCSLGLRARSRSIYTTRCARGADATACCLLVSVGIDSPCSSSSPCPSSYSPSLTPPLPHLSPFYSCRKYRTSACRAFVEDDSPSRDLYHRRDRKTGSAPGC